MCIAKLSARLAGDLRLALQVEEQSRLEIVELYLQLRSNDTSCSMIQVLLMYRNWTVEVGLVLLSVCNA